MLYSVAMTKRKEFDYVIIGSGIAGLSAGLTLAKHGTVAIITKNTIRESATQYAQGGIAVALKKDDAPSYHYNDTLLAGDGLCNEESVKILVQEGPDRVKNLIELGANFDKVGDHFSFTKEAAHSKRRILHAKDATGREIEKTLGNAILQEESVTFFQNTNVIKLHVEKEHCYGCYALQNNEVIYFQAKATLITTGGCGQLFSHTSNPVVATGDGLALGYEAGCTLQDLEFIQFHPTTLWLGDKKPISIFLISEAVRGEGAVLRNINGDRFMSDYDERLELAPRDIVARAIYQEMQKTKNNVFLDLSEIKENVAERFPTIYERCLQAKIDITRDFIPVCPAAHYHMGGIHTSSHGETGINNLFAAGEVSSLGLHGANRLASNSLLDGLVFGHRAAVKAQQSEVVKSDTQPETVQHSPTPQSEKARIKAAKQQIRNTMWRNVSIVRDETTLNYALSDLKKLNWLQDKTYTDTEFLEVKNLHCIATLVTQACLDRKESRGAHYRRDYPAKSPALDDYHQQYSRPKSPVSTL